MADEPSTVDINEPRYLGSRGDDASRPYAKYLQPATLPVQPHVAEAYDGPPTPAESIVPFQGLAEELNAPGYSTVETGYGRCGRIAWAAALTHLPGNTAAMWDWWFGWHSSESARYRLWHPDAHAYAALRHDTTATPGLTDRERYVGNTSYVDEYIGDQLVQLAISFLDPVAAGFHTSADTTVVYGRVGSSALPVALGYLAHQLRPVDDGVEMRSRFYLNYFGVAGVYPPAALAAHKRGSLPGLTQRMPITVAAARDLLEHCGREMNHLGTFLPDLYAEHHQTP